VNKLSQLRQMTDVVADSGDVEAIRQYQPLDATTNPSLLLQAAQMPAYTPRVEEALAAAASSDLEGDELLAAACDHFAIAIGSMILEYIPGRVSTEVDARLSFDTQAMISRAQRLISGYESAGVPRERVLIKLASTWEGIAAARQLERENINCNLTLLFGFTQAVACADAGVFLISPFVGRILDWHMARGEEPASADQDPGVQSVNRIYQYYKQHNYSTVVMGASFRNTGQIEELAGCDRLTISPALLAELEQDQGNLERRLNPEQTDIPGTKIQLDEKVFRWSMNEDEMATEKLAEGIRKFAADQVRLESVFASKL
jgi:transaldolase